MDYLKKLPLNGRQLRSIVNIAKALAAGSLQGTLALRFEHIQPVVDETLAFNKFLKTNKSRVHANFINDSGAIPSMRTDEDSEVE